MDALKIGVLLGVFLALTPTHINWTQTASSLQNRVPRSDPKHYDSVRDAKHWKNPYLVVHPYGIEIIGITPFGQEITVDSVKQVLERLPNSAWPYGLVVAVQDAGVVSLKTDKARIEANRIKLLKLLKELGITVERWPSA